MKLFWLLTIVGCLAGGFILYITVTSASGAPQEASGAAIAVACAVIPYCFARSLQLWNSGKQPINPKLNQICPFCGKVIMTGVAKCSYCASTLNFTKSAELERAISEEKTTLKEEQQEKAERARAHGFSWEESE